jgi:hypothetical protein
MTHFVPTACWFDTIIMLPCIYVFICVHQRFMLKLWQQHNGAQCFFIVICTLINWCYNMCLCQQYPNHSVCSSIMCCWLLTWQYPTYHPVAGVWLRASVRETMLIGYISVNMADLKRVLYVLVTKAMEYPFPPMSLLAITSAWFTLTCYKQGVQSPVKKLCLHSKCLEI